MKKFLSFLTYSIAILLFILFIPIDASANSTTDSFEGFEQLNANYIVVSDEHNGEVTLYSHETGEQNIITKIPNGSQVTVIAFGESLSQIRYVDINTQEEFTGFIKNNHLEEASSSKNLNYEENHQEMPQIDQSSDQNLTEEIIVSEETEESVSLEKSPSIEEDSVSDKIVEQVEQKQQVFAQILSNQPTLSGVALKQSTKIYSEPSLNATHIKSYSLGSILKYQKYLGNWFICTVYVNGKPKTGYIHANDVETSEINQKDLRGLALNNKTNVYTKASTSSKAIRSYTEGSILSFKSFTSNWYEATVYINGKPQIGYIHKNDVSIVTSSPKSVEGYALKNPTNIYAKATKNSNVLKTYSIGQILRYKTFTNEWYEATVYINGKPETGYIHVNDVGIYENSPTIKGIALKTTNIYGKTSTSSEVLKSYEQGKVLRYKYYLPNWYIATVYINGKAKNGYIHADDVENAFSKQSQVRGIGKSNPTPIYDLASTNSSVLKTYDQGSILSYKTFSPNWYEATVYVNGKWKTGYIHKKDVENIISSQKVISGIATRTNGVNVYSKASTLSNVIKSYSSGSVLRFKTFTSNWFEAEVYVNGKKHTGYIHKNDVNTGLYNKVIVLDAGHGGHDGGASGHGIIEKHLNLDVTLELRDKLVKGGAIVHLTRDSDYFISLEERAALSKKVGADIFVSIHANAATPSAYGVETYFSERPYNGETNPYPLESKLLATYVQQHLVSETNMHSRGAKHGGYIVLRTNTVPSILVELGFMTNASDAAKMKQSDYKYKAAEGIYKGIMEYFK